MSLFFFDSNSLFLEARAKMLKLISGFKCRNDDTKGYFDIK